GVAGIVLPLLPTTPFLLLAAACFYRSSPKFHAWLIHHPRLGKYLVYYLDGKGMPLKAKIYTICMIWVTMLISAFVIIDAMAPKFILPAIGAGVTWYILRLPTLQVSSPKSSVSEPPVSTSSVSEPSVSKPPSTGE
ncbi:MAG: YbaN family protein, partial [Oceanobacter sp.]